jgi:homoserine kinase
MKQRVTAFAPATVANLGVGFDILGMAVRGLGDKVTIHRNEQSTEISIGTIIGDKGELPTNPTRNTAAIAAQHVRQQLAETDGLVIDIDKGLPLASGLGSSAASAVAAAVATNVLFGSPLALEDLLPACLEAEAAVSGRHADNVAPALLGGILLIAGIAAETLHRLPYPEDLNLALVTPNVSVPTAEARAILPKQIPLTSMVDQTRAVAKLVHALYRRDAPMAIEAMTEDQVVEPARKSLIPYFDEARKLALDKGVLGMVISGAGPSLCLLGLDEGVMKRAGAAVARMYDDYGIAARVHVTRPDDLGARVLEAE